MARLVEALTGDLEASERAPALRATGDVLAAHLHRVRRGQQSVQLPTFEDPEVWCTIPLDPRLGPSENLNRIYQKARRLERSGERVLERLDATETRLAELRATLETLDEQDLDGLISLDKHLPKSGPTRRPSASDGWDTWTGPDGMRIRVGRNERANRRLCFSVSRGRDWWFHLRNAPGAHVVLRLHGQQSPPLSALLAASELVLMSAKLPEGASADVQYTQVRHLRPIPGEQGGRVRIASERVLRVERDPGQLDGWLREEPLS
jgi:predicted ribosome quality control (RQC) complex YloA/Tae2 family protein